MCNLFETPPLHIQHEIFSFFSRSVSSPLSVREAVSKTLNAFQVTNQNLFRSIRQSVKKLKAQMVEAIHFHFKRGCRVGRTVTISYTEGPSRMEAPTVSKIPQLLHQLTTPDTNAIRAAERELKKLKNNPESINALLGCLQTSSNFPPAVRQVAAVMLGKWIGLHYQKWAKGDKDGLKPALLATLSNEPERSVRVAIVSVISNVAGLPYNETTEGAGHNSENATIKYWPELLNYIASAASNQNEDARDLSFLLLFQMTETVCDSLPDQFASLSHLYGQAMQDPVAKVQASAVKALGETMRYLSEVEEQICIFSSLIPKMLEVSQAAQRMGNEDLIQAVCEVLYDLSMSMAPSVTKFYGETASFVMCVLTDVNLELVTRDAASLVLTNLIEFKPKLFGKKAPVDQIIDSFMVLIETSKESAAGAFFDNNPSWREDAEESDDDDLDNYDGPTQCGMAQGCLDMMACHLPQKYIFNPCMTKCMNRMRSPNPAVRKSGVASLGVVAEGCCEKLCNHLPDVMPQVLACAADADAQVRECTCFTLGQLAEHCQPEILEYSQQILPVVFKLLDDNSIHVQTTSCYVLEMFCEHLEPKSVMPFLDPLTRKLVAMLEVATRKAVQEMSVAAIASTAVAAEKEFIPYLPGVAGIMSKLMNNNDESQYALKGRAMECMGHMAVAVDKDAFRPYFEATMQCTCHALTLDNDELHEYAYAVFANLSKVMEREFSPVLPELVPHMLSLINKSDGIEGDSQKMQELVYKQAGVEGGGDSDDSDDDDNAQYPMTVTTAFLECKKAAIMAIGEMASHCGVDFGPYLKGTYDSLAQASTYWHPVIKEWVVKAFPSLIICCVATDYPDGKVPWEKGNMTHNPLSANTRGLCVEVLNKIVPMLSNPEKEVVSSACEGIQAIIELCGPQSLLPVADPVLTGLLTLMQGKAVCQQEYQLDDDEEDEDEHEDFMNSVLDLIGAISRVMGAQFTQYLPTFMPHILNFAKTSSPANDRSMAIGLLGELAQGIGPSIASQWPTAFFPKIQEGCADSENLTVQRNAAFAAGVCCEAMGEASAPFYPAILQILHPLFSINSAQSDSSAAVVDNAAAAIARMIIANPNHIPYPQVLPIFFSVLPLKSDMSENETIFECIIKLWQSNQPDVTGSLKNEVIRVVRTALESDSKVDEEIQNNLRNVFGIPK